ncbi:MAG: hypothetical protein ACKVTZ_08535 [Bacteroidia bacterium]
MKKLIFTFIVLVAFATTADAQMRPAKGDMGLGFKITGLSNVAFGHWDKNDFEVPQLLYRYYLSDKLALRAGLGVDINNTTKSYKRDAIVGVVRTIIDRDSAVSGTVFSIAPGVEYHLTSPATKIDPYVGLTVGISYKGTTRTVVKDNVDELTNNQQTLIQRLTTTTDAPGGMGIGASALVGFNYFFSDNFAIGAEYGLGFNRLTTGGTHTTVATGTIEIPGVSSTTLPGTPVQYQAVDGGTRVNTMSTGGVNISVFW